MIFVLQEYWLPIVLSLLIGVLTGLWIWRGRDEGAASPSEIAEPEARPREAVPGTAYYKATGPAPPEAVDPPVSPPLARTDGAPPPPQTVAAEPTSGRVAPIARAGPPPPPVHHNEGHGVADAGAAAVEDIADEFLGIDSHPASEPDDLTRMKGVGPKLASLLNDVGITRYEEIAGWSDAELDAMDARMGSFRGRLRRDRVVEQAGFLARGDRAGYEAVFGKLGG